MNVTAIKEEMAQTIRALHLKGWSPATSTNYSFREDEGQIWVSRSGVDKSNFLSTDFITVDPKGNANGEFVGVKPSAETLIHCVIYALFPETKVIYIAMAFIQLSHQRNPIQSLHSKDMKCKKDSRDKQHMREGLKFQYLRIPKT